MKLLKISVIGCGYWGKNLIRNFSELGSLFSVCDANTELAQKMSLTYNVPALSFADILQSPTQGVVIVAPAAQHFALAYEALKANKHVFVEKPLALKSEEAEILCKLAAEKSKVLMVGHLLQYHPAFLKLKELIASGSLGRLDYIYSNRLNLGKIRNEENILWSFAPHDISMILGLAADNPEYVYATGACHLNPHIYDVTTTHLVFKNGLKAHIFVSWLHPYKEQKLVVIGDRGMVVFDDSLAWDEKLKLYLHQVTWRNGLPQPEKAEGVALPLDVAEPLKLECQHFMDCIEHNKVPYTDGLEGLRVLRILEMAEQSLKTQKNIDFHHKTLPYSAHETAWIDDDCHIGVGTKIWHFTHIIQKSIIGKNCTIGQNVVIGPSVTVGDNCKIQNNVSLYQGVTLEEGVFCGPSCVFTNVLNPRAEVNRRNEFRPTYVERGATIGANATIVCGNRLGAYSLIGAGAVVTKDVKPHAVMVGNPARQIGWVSHAGEILDDTLFCAREGRQYRIIEQHLIEVKLNDLVDQAA